MDGLFDAEVFGEVEYRARGRNAKVPPPVTNPVCLLALRQVKRKGDTVQSERG